MTYSASSLNFKQEVDQLYKFDVDNKLFEPWKRLGYGAYGAVMSYKMQIDGTISHVAIKRMINIFNDDLVAKRSLRELRLLRLFNHGGGHPNIVPLLDAFLPTNENESNFTDVYMVCRLMGTNLKQKIINMKCNGVMSTEQQQQFIQDTMRQLVAGVGYIHAGGVVHRDLKSENILVRGNDDKKINAGDVKLGDFGQARPLIDTGNQTINDTDNQIRRKPVIDTGNQISDFVSTPPNRAPELMQPNAMNDKSIDIWSLGCIFSELLLLNENNLFTANLEGTSSGVQIDNRQRDAIAARMGWNSINNGVLSFDKFKQRFQKVLPLADDNALDLLRRMLTRSPTDRITITDIAEHPYFSQNGGAVTITSPSSEVQQLLQSTDIDQIAKSTFDYVKETRNVIAQRSWNELFHQKIVQEIRFLRSGVL